jgi:hypothetical protein
MKKLIIPVTFLSWLNLANATELYYVSEDPTFLENKITVAHNGFDYKFSTRPYGGFVIEKAFKVKFDEKFSVQLSGKLLEKDWPTVSLAAKLGNSWKLDIEKNHLVDDRAILIIRGLTEKEADLFVEKLILK